MATSVDVHAANRREVFKCLLRIGSTTKTQLAGKLGMSYPTVKQILDELEKEGLISVLKDYQKTGGRNARVSGPKMDYHVALGVDISQNHLNLVLLDLGENVLKSRRVRIPFVPAPDYYFFLKHSIQEMVEGYEDRLLGVKISMPTIVQEDGVTLFRVPLLGDCEDFYKELEPYINFPFSFVNDACAGAYAQIQEDEDEEELQDFLYLMLSNTVGGALVLDGKLVKGMGLRTGEFGHMILIQNGRKCFCGQKGCVGEYLSATCLAERLEPFFEDLAKGDEEALKKWRAYKGYLETLLHNLQMGLNLKIILGGYVGHHLVPYLDEIQEEVAQRSFFQDDAIYIRAGNHGYLASAYGAAKMLIQGFIERI